MTATRYMERILSDLSKYLNEGMFSSSTDEWETPKDLFDRLNDEFRFTLDVCATAENAKCSRYFTKEQDGLLHDWTGETVWCNPPYGKGMDAWCRKCYEHFIGGGVLRSC